MAVKQFLTVVADYVAVEIALKVTVITHKLKL